MMMGGDEAIGREWGAGAMQVVDGVIPIDEAAPGGGLGGDGLGLIGVEFAYQTVDAATQPRRVDSREPDPRVAYHAAAVWAGLDGAGPVSFARAGDQTALAAGR